MQQILGIDIGFGFTNATNGRDTIIFKSLSGDANDIQVLGRFGDSNRSTTSTSPSTANRISSASRPSSSPTPRNTPWIRNGSSWIMSASWP